MCSLRKVLYFLWWSRKTTGYFLFIANKSVSFKVRKGFKDMISVCYRLAARTDIQWVNGLKYLGLYLCPGQSHTVLVLLFANIVCCCKCGFHFQSYGVIGPLLDLVRLNTLILHQLLFPTGMLWAAPGDSVHNSIEKEFGTFQVSQNIFWWKDNIIFSWIVVLALVHSINRF